MALYKFRMGAMQSIKKLGIRVVAVAPPDAYSDKIKKAGLEFVPIKMAANQISVYKDVLFFWHLYQLFRRFKPDLVFNYTVKINIFGNLAAWLAGKIPTISIVPGRGFSFQHKGWLFSLVKTLYKISLSPARAVWFLNEEDRQFFVSQKILKPVKTKLLPGEGINTSFYLPQPAKKINPANHHTFLLSGRMLWEKGVGDFVAAARIVRLRYPMTQFHLLGFVDAKDKRIVPIETIHQWVAEGTVSFMGVTEDVRPFFHQADCFVLPSYYGEGLPRTILEAASMGIPVITTDHRGCRRAVIPRENGFLCSPQNPEELAHKMLEFIELPLSEKRKMGERGRQMVRDQFEEKLVVDIYLQQVEEILSIKPPTLSAVSAKENKVSVENSN